MLVVTAGIWTKPDKYFALSFILCIVLICGAWSARGVRKQKDSPKDKPKLSSISLESVLRSSGALSLRV